MHRFLLVCIAFCLEVVASQSPEIPGLQAGLYAEITTARGILIAELHFKRAPLTVASFVGLAEGRLGSKPGNPFFDGLVFHRVVPGFVIQGGDPLGTGEGGPGYEFPDELVPGLRHDAAGILSMANSGPDTNGSQFFITLNPFNRLNYLHSVFGRVVRGEEILSRIAKGDAMRIRILRVGADAAAFAADRESFERLKARAKAYHGPVEPGPDACFDDRDRVLPTEPPRARGFNFKLANFKRATGLELRVHLLARTPREMQGRAEYAQAYLANAAARLGLGDDAVLAFQFADGGGEALWLGKVCRARLAQAGADEPRDAQALVAKARRAAALALTEAARSQAPGLRLSASQRIKLGMDALVDTLIFALEPRHEMPSAGRP